MKKFFFASAVAFAVAVSPVSASMDTQSKSDVCLDGSTLTGASFDVFGYVQRWLCKYGTHSTPSNLKGKRAGEVNVSLHFLHQKWG